MACIQPRYGTFATLENHGHWYGEMSELQVIFRKCGIPLLNNTQQVNSYFFSSAYSLILAKSLGRLISRILAA